MGALTIVLIALFIVVFFMRRRRKRRIDRMYRRGFGGGTGRIITVKIGDD